MRISFPLFIAFLFLSSSPFLFPQEGQYKVVRIVKAGGAGGFDYVYADIVNRNLYIPRSGHPGKITIFNLDTLKLTGIIPNISAHGVAVSPKASHAFASSKPVAMWDAKTLTLLKILFVACREPPTLVVMNAQDGTIITTFPIGRGTDGATFNPATLEAFSSNSDGTLTVIKESSPQYFAVEQSVKTEEYAKTSTLDAKTGHIFLITADFGPLPANQGKGRNSNRGPMIPDSFSILEVGN
jgi:hypothetical protein